MTTGRPIGLITAFALPLMLANVFQQLYTVVDTMVVGKGLGVGALAALGAIDWLNWMMLGIVQGLAQGFSILMAQEFGARAYERLRTVVGTSLTLAAVSSVVLLVVGQLLAVPALQLIKGTLGYRLLMIIFKLLLLPLVVGITFEFNRWAGRSDGKIAAALRTPGMLMQKFTTNEPDDSMIEVGIAAVKAVLPEEEGADRW